MAEMRRTEESDEREALEREAGDVGMRLLRFLYGDAASDLTSAKVFVRTELLSDVARLTMDIGAVSQAAAAGVRGADRIVEVRASSPSGERLDAVDARWLEFCRRFDLRPVWEGMAAMEVRDATADLAGVLSRLRASRAELDRLGVLATLVVAAGVFDAATAEAIVDDGGYVLEVPASHFDEDDERRDAFLRSSLPKPPPRRAVGRVAATVGASPAGDAYDGVRPGLEDADLEAWVERLARRSTASEL